MPTPKSQFHQDKMKEAKKLHKLIVALGFCNPLNHPNPRELDAIRFSFHHNLSDVGSSTSFAMARRFNTPAIAMCVQCPVRTECLDYALLVNEPSSIWGGYPARLRKAILRATFGEKGDPFKPYWSPTSWRRAKALVKRTDKLVLIPSQVFGRDTKVTIPNLYALLKQKDRRKKRVGSTSASRTNVI